MMHVIQVGTDSVWMSLDGNKVYTSKAEIIRDAIEHRQTDVRVINKDTTHSLYVAEARR